MKLGKMFTLLLILLQQVSFGQEKRYAGSFNLSGEAEQVTEKSIQIVVQGNEFTAVLHLRQNKVFMVFDDKRDHSGDYTDITGNCRGTIIGNQLSGKCTLAVIENEAGVITRSNPPAAIKASVSGQEISGQLTAGEEDDDEPFIIPFSVFESGNEKPELSYPAGMSPKVFDQGWVFGAVFRLMDKNGKLVDLSDQVEWSGTGSFNPSKGKLCRPVFNNPGANSIILSATYEGRTYKNEFPVEAVSYLDYAHTGSLAKSLSDSHGCPGCPHTVIGPVVSGSALVFAGPYPAARVGDRGIHSACCEHNSFVITSGDPEVLIEGKPAAKPGMSKTRHCGGEGWLIKGALVMEEGLLMTGFVLNNPGATNGESGEYLKLLKAMHAGDNFSTGQKGILAFPGNDRAVITLFPESAIKVIENTKEWIRLLLVKGRLMVNGNTSTGKKIRVDVKDFTINPLGTKFLAETDSAGANFAVYVFEGRISMHPISGGRETEADSGFIFRYSAGRISVTPMEPGSEGNKMRELMADVDSRSVTARYDTTTVSLPAMERPAAVKNAFLKNNLIYFAGGGALLILLLVIFLAKKRKGKE